MDQGPNGALKAVFLNMAITLELMNLETQNFFQKIEHQKIFDKCLGVFQNLDQGPDGALKTLFLTHSYNFGMDEPRDPLFFKCRALKNICHVSRGFPKFGPGA